MQISIRFLPVLQEHAPWSAFMALRFTGRRLHHGLVTAARPPRCSCCYKMSARARL